MDTQKRDIVSIVDGKSNRVKAMDPKWGNVSDLDIVSIVDGKSKRVKAMDPKWGNVSDQEQEKAVHRAFEIYMHELLLSNKDAEEKTGKQPADSTLNETHNCLDGLVRLLFNDASFVQESAASALANVAENRELSHLLVAREGLLKGLARLLQEKSSPEVQHEATRIVANLASTDKIEILDEMLPHFLPTLVRLLYKDKDIIAQNQAIRALANFARSPENKFRISQYPDALKGMVQLISGVSDHDTRNLAATAVANVCTTDEMHH